MPNFEPIAIDLLAQITLGDNTFKEALDKIEFALQKAYDLGKKHLIEPHHLICGDDKIIKERDTHSHE